MLLSLALGNGSTPAVIAMCFPRQPSEAKSFKHWPFLLLKLESTPIDFGVVGVAACYRGCSLRLVMSDNGKHAEVTGGFLRFGTISPV